MEDRRILVVEDEQAIAEIIAFNLKKEGFSVETCDDGAEGLEKALKLSPDLILLDVMLPNMDGFEILKRLRQKSRVPVIMLTAREEEEDKITGLDLGADDYITKPFSMRELLARVKANMRRSASSAEISDSEQQKKETYGGICIYPDRHEARKNGQPVELTVREYELLAYLCAERGRVVSREELMKKVWGYEYYGDLRAVDVAVRRLREKLEDDSAAPSLIMTKRGLGYYFNDR